MAHFEVLVAARAMTEIQKISRWWIKHRRASPRLFDRELASSIDLLEAQPEIGVLRRLPSIGEVRLVVLRRSRYLVMYQIDSAARQVWIVRVRYAKRRPLLRPR
jgi:plasmid stabilization system protein ParE